MELLNHRVSAVNESFSFSAHSLAFDVVIVFNLVILVGMHFVKRLLKSFAYTFLLSCMSYFLWESFYILDTNPLLDTCIVNIFSYSVSYSFL